MRSTLRSGVSNASEGDASCSVLSGSSRWDVRMSQPGVQARCPPTLDQGALMTVCTAFYRTHTSSARTLTVCSIGSLSLLPTHQRIVMFIVTDSLQRLASTWRSEFSQTCQQPGFSLVRYINDLDRSTTARATTARARAAWNGFAR